MLDLNTRGYLPLEEGHVHHDTPPLPGVLVLAIRLAGGVHHNFYTKKSENLRYSLRTILEDNLSPVPDIVFQYRKRFKCYFTYVVALSEQYRSDLELMLSRSSNLEYDVNPAEDK